MAEQISAQVQQERLFPEELFTEKPASFQMFLGQVYELRRIIGTSGSEVIQASAHRALTHQIEQNPEFAERTVSVQEYLAERAVAAAQAAER